MDENWYRWAFLALLLLNLGISAVFRRRARLKSGAIPRSEEGKLALARLAFAVPSLAVLVGYLVAPEWSGWPRLPLPSWLRLAGIVLGSGCAVWLYWVLKTIGSNISETVLTKSGHELVTEGPYRWIRHPLYTGGLAFVLSLVLVSANALLLVLEVAFLLFLFGVVIPREEAHLIGRFGERYRAYQQRTGRLLPRLKSG